MQCVVCEAEIPENVANCPECGDHIGKWLEMRSTAEMFLGEGASFDAGGDVVRAALSFQKAVFLLPEEHTTLRAFGMFLARHELYHEALYYLGKALEHKPDDGDVEAAIAKIGELLAADSSGAEEESEKAEPCSETTDAEEKTPDRETEDAAEPIDTEEDGTSADPGPETGESESESVEQTEPLKEGESSPTTTDTDESAITPEQKAETKEAQQGGAEEPSSAHTKPTNIPGSQDPQSTQKPSSGTAFFFSKLKNLFSSKDQE